jgi:hypothetical protein
VRRRGDLLVSTQADSYLHPVVTTYRNFFGGQVLLVVTHHRASKETTG